MPSGAIRLAEGTNVVAPLLSFPGRPFRDPYSEASKRRPPLGWSRVAAIAVYIYEGDLFGRRRPVPTGDFGFDIFSSGELEVDASFDVVEYLCRFDSGCCFVSVWSSV